MTKDAIITWICKTLYYLIKIFKQYIYAYKKYEYENLSQWMVKNLNVHVIAFHRDRNIRKYSKEDKHMKFIL